MADYRVLAVVRHLGRARVNRVAAALGDEGMAVFQECRNLEQQAYLREVQPMTFAITDDGVDHLEEWLRSNDSVDPERLRPDDDVQPSGDDQDADAPSKGSDASSRDAEERPSSATRSTADGTAVDRQSAGTERDQAAETTYRVLAAVRYLDRGEIKHVAALAGTNVATAFRTCRALEREDDLEKVRPMTYRITSGGIDALEDRNGDHHEALGSAETVQEVVDSLVAEDGEVRSGPLSLAANEPAGERPRE